MKFSVLADILERENLISNVVINRDCDVTDLNLMDKDYRDFNDHTAYFIDASLVKFYTAIPDCLFYFGTLPPLKEKVLINAAQISPDATASVFRFVKAQLDTAPQAQQQYTDVISKLIMGADLNSILSELHTRTGNLFAAIDMSGKILARCTPFQIDSPPMMLAARDGYCDEFIMDHIATLRNANIAPKGEEPFQLYCPKTKMHILCVRIIHEYNLLGYFFAFNSTPSFDNQTRRLLPLFAQRVRDSIMKLKSYNSYSSIMRNSILLDAAAGASPAEIRLRTKIASLVFPPYMRAFVIRSSHFKKDQHFYEAVLQPVMAKAFPDVPCFLWNNSLAALVATDSNGNLSPDVLEKFQALTMEYRVLIGISNYFTDITRFSEYFDQALTVLSFSNRVGQSNPMFYFLDYTLFMLLDKVEDDRMLDQYCHPALAKLLEYDAQKNTDLYNTLRLYTFYGFNKSQTAKAMFSHRNTIIYRISQIEEICGIDLSNTDLLFTLLLSFWIYDYRQGRFSSRK